MTNFERAKDFNSEYEMTDMISYIIATKNIYDEEGNINSLNILKYLQEDIK